MMNHVIIGLFRDAGRPCFFLLRFTANLLQMNNDITGKDTAGHGIENGRTLDLCGFRERETDRQNQIKERFVDYYNWPAQLKAVVDRFYSFTTELTYMHKKTVLLSAAWDNSDTVFAVVEAYYRQLCDYMRFEDKGVILGKGCGTPSMTASTKYPDVAYELGKNI